MQNFKELNEDELLNVLCFFCDYIENTDARLDHAVLNQVAGKFLEISNHNEDEIEDHIMQTICYGFGVIGYNLPNGSFQCAAEAAKKCKKFLQVDDAFSEDRIIATESTMGAIARMAYMHLDGKALTNDDLISVLGKMPFTAYDDENKSAHRILIEQFMVGTSHVHNSSVKPHTVEALKRIRDYQGSAKVLSLASKQQLAQLQF